MLRKFSHLILIIFILSSCGGDESSPVRGFQPPRLPHPISSLNPNSDTDGDGIKDSQDNCPTVANPNQSDSDRDGRGDACSPVVIDSDGDGIPDERDNCPGWANADQKDTDNDGKGDVCDEDGDGDGVEDWKDNCPEVANSDQKDVDQDMVGDACDTNIGDREQDSDGDGFPNVSDPCPHIKNGRGSGVVFNGRPAECYDSDHDRIADGVDNCPYVFNPGQEDTNHNGVGNACANNDNEKDGVIDDQDECPYHCDIKSIVPDGNRRCYLRPGEVDSDGNGLPDDKVVSDSFLSCLFGFD